MATSVHLNRGFTRKILLPEVFKSENSFDTPNYFKGSTYFLEGVLYASKYVLGK